MMQVTIMKVYQNGTSARHTSFDTVEQAQAYLREYRETMAETGEIIDQTENSFTVKNGSGTFAYEVRA